MSSESMKSAPYSSKEAFLDSMRSWVEERTHVTADFILGTTDSDQTSPWPRFLSADMAGKDKRGIFFIKSSMMIV